MNAFCDLIALCALFVFPAPQPVLHPAVWDPNPRTDADQLQVGVGCRIRGEETMHALKIINLTFYNLLINYYFKINLLLLLIK